MIIWIKERFGIIKSALHHPTLLFIWGLLNVADLIFGRFLSQNIDSKIPRISTLMPWHFWVIGWLLLLLCSVIEYALKIEKEAIQNKNKPKTKLMAVEDFYEHKCLELERKIETNSITVDVINIWQRKLLRGVATAFGEKELDPFRRNLNFIIFTYEKVGLKEMAMEFIKLLKKEKEGFLSSDLLETFEPEDFKKFDEE